MTGQPKPRLFLAVPLPAALKQQLHQQCQTIRGQYPFKKWVHEADYHITVKFLGGVEREVMKQISEVMVPVTATQQPFMLQTGGLGSFGKPESPRILWTKVSGDLDRLAHLHKETDFAMQPLGFIPENRPCRPHITIAKTYIGKSRLTARELEQAAASIPVSPAFTVTELVLYQTHLGRVPMYEPIAFYPLGHAK